MAEPPPTATMPSMACPRGEGDRVVERLVGRLDAHAVVDARPRRLRASSDSSTVVQRRQAGDDRVGDHQRAAHAEVGQVHADLAGDAGAEADAGGGHLEGVFVRHGGSLPSARSSRLSRRRAQSPRRRWAAPTTASAASGRSQMDRRWRASGQASHQRHRRHADGQRGPPAALRWRATASPARRADAPCRPLHPTSASCLGRRADVVVDVSGCRASPHGAS